MIAYTITNLLNGKRYIGITRRSLKVRWAEHRGYVKSPENPLHFAMAKHGKENFVIEQVASARSWTDLQELERVLIAQEGTSLDLGCGYNATSGGETLAGYFASVETKARMAAAQLGRKHTDEARANISASHMGKKLSDEHKEAVRISRMGNQGCLGRVLSEETRAKIATSLTGKKASPEARAKMSTRRRGRLLPARSFTPRAVARRALAAIKQTVGA